MTQNIKLLNISEVAQKLSAGKSTIYDWMSPKSKRFKKDFPKPLRKIGGVNRCLESEIDAWVLTHLNLNQDAKAQ